MSGTNRFIPTGSVLLTPADSKANMDALPQAGVLHVLPDSGITLASLDVTGPVTAEFVAGSVETGITAKAGGGQAGTLLTAANNFIATCATAADSVVLPADAPIGAPVFLRNDGAKNAQVFAEDPGTINGVATGTGVTLNAASSATYRQSAAGKWVT